MSKRGYTLSERQLRALTVAQRPALDASGKTVLVPNPTGKPYRFQDATTGSPTGFGVYVGMTASTFEVRKRVGESFVRVALGSVDDMSIEQAHAKAREHLAYIVESGGESPRRKQESDQAIADLRRITVRQCLDRYIARMRAQVDAGKRKANSTKAVENSLARLARAEVGLADKAIRNLDRDTIVRAWNNLRTSAMLKSNRLPEEVKVALAAKDKWWGLDPAEYRAIGLSGKHIQRAMSAGIEAVEHTFADVSRAIELVLRQERLDAAREGRDVVLQSNPIEILFDMELWRGAKEKREHYRRAQVRNPLGKDDGTLPAVLKTLVYRRNLQNGLNAVAVDYLLLTLLWGCRRNEGAPLQWYSKASADDLAMERVSWVWLSDSANAINPTTRRRGSQVFFHDTKGGEVRFLPVAYFAERILRMRWADCQAVEERLPIELDAARKAVAAVRKGTRDYIKIAKAEQEVSRIEQKAERLKWVFPARSTKSREGHYSDSKSILKNVRVDAGMLDLRKEIDIGLTPHDLRRTLGRFAEALLGGRRIVSDMLNHKVQNGAATVTDLYNEQEWSELREAFAKVEEVMIGTSPRVWNLLKGSDKPRMDEVNDKPVAVHSGLRARQGEEE